MLSLSVAVAQSYRTVSGHVIWYQNETFVVPVGALNVCEIDESPLVGDVEPRNAANEPLCGADVVTLVEPAVVHPLSVPVSKPPFTIPPLVGTLTVSEYDVV